MQGGIEVFPREKGDCQLKVGLWPMLIFCFLWLCWGKYRPALCKVFPRRRFDPLVKAYTLGLSLRQVVAFLRDMGFSVGRESVGRWFLKVGEMLSRDGVGRRFIAVDEAVVFNLSGRAYLRAAREVML